ncbi:MAG: hypothetical protein H7A36_07275 [Chlamydiales bacterium]|nr:hypothetical protein [Chlamydiales bacterium]
MADLDCPEVDYFSVKVALSKVTNPIKEDVWGVAGLAKIRLKTRHRLLVNGYGTDFKIEKRNR